MKGSGVYIKRWNGYSWEFKELPKKKKVKFSWRSVLFLVCLLSGLLVGYVIGLIG
jgi:hypothetical protein